MNCAGCTVLTRRVLVRFYYFLKTFSKLLLKKFQIELILGLGTVNKAWMLVPTTGRHHHRQANRIATKKEKLSLKTKRVKDR
ncbi:hypothetical protein Peur_021904 [Populus x canadensis]